LSDLVRRPETIRQHYLRPLSGMHVRAGQRGGTPAALEETK
jgi:hypothetical protein